MPSVEQNCIRKDNYGTGREDKGIGIYSVPWKDC